MTKLHMPTGLVKYSNQDAVDRKPSGLLRARLFVYPVVLAIVGSLFTYLFWNKKDFDAKLYRNFGNSYAVGTDSWIDNSLKLSLTNRTDGVRTYQVKMLVPEGARARSIESEEIRLEPQQHRTLSMLLSSPFSHFKESRCEVKLQIVDDQGEARVLPYVMLGPYQLMDR